MEGYWINNKKWRELLNKNSNIVNFTFFKCKTLKKMQINKHSKGLLKWNLTQLRYFIFSLGDLNISYS